MAAYTILFNLIRDYFVDLGYNDNYIQDIISARTIKEVAVICLANANIMIKNKTDRSSHQTHIAITGEMIDFFCPWTEFEKMGNDVIHKSPVLISPDNIKDLNNEKVFVSDPQHFEIVEGVFTWGKRTQNQLQLSKRNSGNSPCFNELRLGLFENDLLYMMKCRENGKILAVGIPQTYYLDTMPSFKDNYETNTYLRIPYKPIIS